MKAEDFMMLMIGVLAILTVSLLIYAAVLPQLIDIEHQHIIGEVKDVKITSGGFLSSAKTVYYFENGEVVVVKGIHPVDIGRRVDLHIKRTTFGVDECYFVYMKR